MMIRAKVKDESVADVEAAVRTMFSATPTGVDRHPGDQRDPTSWSSGWRFS
jgi:hypothetical protein